MVVRVTHSKVSGKPAGSDPARVYGTHWDEDHVVEGLDIGTDVQAHDATLDALSGKALLGTGDIVLSSTLGGYQPLDSDLTAIAALTTTGYGRALLALADAAALRTAAALATTTTDNAIIRADGTTGQTQTSLAVVDDSGNLILGNVNTAISTDGAFETWKDTGSNWYNNSFTNTGSSPGVQMRRGRGTKASPAAVQLGDRLGAYFFVGQQSTTPGDTDASASIIAAAAENWSSGVNGSYFDFEATTSGGTARTAQFRVAGGAIYAQGVGTTASAANAFLDSGSTPANQLLRSTSSGRYKRDVEDLDPTSAQKFLKEARPVWYRSKIERDCQDWSWYGLIAEDVAKLDPRLVHWGYRDEDWEIVPTPTDDDPDASVRKLKDGAEKVPDGVQYERLSVILLSIVQQQEARISALEEAIKTLRAD